MVREDKRGGFRDAQAVLDLHAGRLQLVDFLEQRLGREHHTVTDVARDAITHDARRDQTQDRLLAADDEGMACVMSALETNHALRMIGQPIDDFPFTFVTPLGADDDDIASLAHCWCGHVEFADGLKTYSTLVVRVFPEITGYLQNVMQHAQAKALRGLTIQLPLSSTSWRL